MNKHHHNPPPSLEAISPAVSCPAGNCCFLHLTQSDAHHHHHNHHNDNDDHDDDVDDDDDDDDDVADKWANR